MGVDWTVAVNVLRATDFWSAIDAIGSLGGMILAGVAGLVGYRLFKVESERDLRADQFHREQVAKQTRDQAERVGFWREQESGTLVILNSSSLPIFGIEVRYPDHGDRPVDSTLEMNSTTVLELAAIPPGEKAQLTRLAFTAAIKDLRYRRREWRPYLVFTDNAGNQWARRSDGTLQPTR